MVGRYPGRPAGELVSCTRGGAAQCSTVYCSRGFRRCLVPSIRPPPSASLAAVRPHHREACRGITCCYYSAIDDPLPPCPCLIAAIPYASQPLMMKRAIYRNPYSDDGNTVMAGQSFIYSFVQYCTLLHYSTGGHQALWQDMRGSSGALQYCRRCLDSAGARQV